MPLEVIQLMLSWNRESLVADQTRIDPTLDNFLNLWGEEVVVGPESNINAYIPKPGFVTDTFKRVGSAEDLKKNLVSAMFLTESESRMNLLTETSGTARQFHIVGGRLL